MVRSACAGDTKRSGTSAYVSAILRLEILRGAGVRRGVQEGRRSTRTWCGFQSLSKMMTVSAAARGQLNVRSVDRRAAAAQRTRLKVEPESSGARGQDKYGELGVGLVERLEERRAVFVLRRAVQAEVVDLAVVEVVFEDGHHGLREARRQARFRYGGATTAATHGHLEKHEHAVACGEELGQNAVEQLKLSGGAVEHVEVLADGVDRALDLSEAERVVADLRPGGLARARPRRPRRGFAPCGAA